MIRLAEDGDMEAVLAVYQSARRYMAEHGNPGQWGRSYPSRVIIDEDIRCGRLYVDTEGGEVHSSFVFSLGEEPTYRYIEDGAWKDDGPYGTIHRLASDGREAGAFGRCFAFCMERADCLRIDTHRDNHAMRHLIEKHGFERCGVIYVGDGTPRIAYQYCGAAVH